jgi:hypothetical protein
VVGKLRKGHRQIPVATGEASMVRISTIALDALLKLVGGQVIQKLGEDSLSGIHPSFSAIGMPCGHSALALASAAKNSNRKMRVIFYRV